MTEGATGYPLLLSGASRREASPRCRLPRLPPIPACRQQLACVLAAQDSAEAYAEKRRIVGQAVAQSGARDELLGGDALICAVPAGHQGGAAAAAATGPIGLGQGLHPEDRAELAQQTARQEACLDQIDVAAGALRAMGLVRGRCAGRAMRVCAVLAAEGRRWCALSF